MAKRAGGKRTWPSPLAIVPFRMASRRYVPRQRNSLKIFPMPAKKDSCRKLLTYTRPHVLVIDEIGYLSYGPDAANVLFHVVNHRHLKKRPMIFTTNKPLNEWGKVLYDEDLAAAILDRVLERGRFIQLNGVSGRTRHLKLDEVWSAAADRARISGKSVPQFPEPTSGAFRCIGALLLVGLETL